jgi:hypothetical protein
MAVATLFNGNSTFGCSLNSAGGLTVLYGPVNGLQQYSPAGQYGQVTVCAFVVVSNPATALMSLLLAAGPTLSGSIYIPAYSSCIKVKLIG